MIIVTLEDNFLNSIIIRQTVSQALKVVIIVIGAYALISQIKQFSYYPHIIL